MLGEIAWAIVCFGIGWFCRGKFGSFNEMYRQAESLWKKNASSKPDPPRPNNDEKF